MNTNDGCDGGAVTSILDTSAVARYEKGASMGECRELHVVPGPLVVSTSIDDAN